MSPITYSSPTTTGPKSRPQTPRITEVARKPSSERPIMFRSERVLVSTMPRLASACATDVPSDPRQPVSPSRTNAAEIVDGVRLASSWASAPAMVGLAGRSATTAPSRPNPTRAPASSE